MKTIYECECCHKQFDDISKCTLHELLHYNGEAAIRHYIQHVAQRALCEGCDNVYYVYNCEVNCCFTSCGPANNYKDFKPKEGVFDDFKR